VLAETTDFCRLVLLRHPDLADEHAQRAIGRGPADLSRRGRAQILRWLEAFKGFGLDEVWSGGQPQCADPARALAQGAGLEAKVDPRLEDQDLGAWQGRPWDEVFHGDPERVRDFFGHFGEIAPPEGEALGVAVERMLAWWQERAPGAVGRKIAIVAPGSLISGVVAALLGMRLSRGVSFNLPGGGFGMLDVFANGVRVATWNPGALEGTP